MIYEEENAAGLDEKYEVKIVLENGTEIKCFDNEPYNGWCGVCEANAISGNRGHCGPGSASSWGKLVSSLSGMDEATKVTPTSKWGWCGDSCYYRLRSHPTPSYLQVASVNILGLNDCVLFCFC